MRKLILPLALLAILAVIGISIFVKAPVQKPPAMGPMPVDIAQVVQRDVTVWQEFSGRMVAIDRVDVRPQIAGTIESINFKDGDLVEKGQLLFQIDPRPYQAAMLSAKARADYAAAEFKRAEEMIGSKAISQREYDDRKNAAAVANADLTTASLNLDYTHVTAPVAGRVSRAEITVGNLVSSGGEAPVLTRIVSVDPIYADFDVDEQNFVRYVALHNADTDAMKKIPVQLGFMGQADFPVTGAIESFDNQLDTKTGTVRVRALFDNKNSALVPGLFARVRLGGEEVKNAILIDDGAIGTDQDRKYVYVIGDDNKAQYRTVKTGAMVDGLRLIEDGLKSDDKVVVSGLQRVHPDAQVAPTVVDMPHAGGSPAATASPATENGG